MKILFLSPHIHLINYLVTYGDDITQTEEKLTEEILQDIDFIISYDYRYIIGKEGHGCTHINGKPILEIFKDRAINLHISYLPWNRGADPTFWEFIDNTPKGVTIHYLEKELDKGDIIAQRYLKYDPKDTLRTFYTKKHECIEDMFKKVWAYIREGKAKRYKQCTYHKVSDKEEYKYLLQERTDDTDEYDTPVINLIGKGVKRII